MKDRVKFYKKHTSWIMKFLLAYRRRRIEVYKRKRAGVALSFLALGFFLFFQCIKYTNFLLRPYVIINKQGVTVQGLLKTQTILWKDICHIKREAKIIEKYWKKSKSNEIQVRKKKHVDFVVYTSKDATKPTLSINLLSLKIDEAEFMAFVKKYYPANKIIEKNYP